MSTELYALKYSIWSFCFIASFSAFSRCCDLSSRSVKKFSTEELSQRAKADGGGKVTADAAPVSAHRRGIASGRPWQQKQGLEVARPSQLVFFFMKRTSLLASGGEQGS